MADRLFAKKVEHQIPVTGYFLSLIEGLTRDGRINNVLCNGPRVGCHCFVIMEMGEHNCAFFDDKQLPRQPFWVLRICLLRNAYEIDRQKPLMLRCSRVNRMGAILIFR